jgi:hypothetical protein
MQSTQETIMTEEASNESLKRMDLSTTSLKGARINPTLNPEEDEIELMFKLMD